MAVLHARDAMVGYTYNGYNPFTPEERPTKECDIYHNPVQFSPEPGVDAVDGVECLSVSEICGIAFSQGRQITASSALSRLLFNCFLLHLLE